MRKSGILLHISSLPSPFGIGDLGPAAYQFINFLKNSGQCLWQILPINPTDGINAHSPYSCSSAFAFNPLLISPQMLVRDGYLQPRDIAIKKISKKVSVEYQSVKLYKEKLFHQAYVRWSKNHDEAYSRFCHEQAFWLNDYAVFMAAKKVYHGNSWQQWPKPLKLREVNALKNFTLKNREIIEEVKFVQFLFYQQWRSLVVYAHDQGISIIGDIPIYVNYDSADVWCYSQFFKLTDNKDLKFVSGCPPDYFSKTGQRWGNPVYDWKVLKRNKYDWWVKRVAHNLTLFDFLRIDHFRGFESFWQIPAKERLAVFGRWVKAPGKDFFETLCKRFKHLPIIAEDLGEISSGVLELMKQFGFPGMRVLLFGFGGDIRTNPHVPANYVRNCVAYSGTHDNNTIVGWFKNEASQTEKNNIVKVLARDRYSVKGIHWDMIEVLMASKANTVIFPMQDVLGKGQEARMNLPSTTMLNWSWRMKNNELTKLISLRLLKMSKKYKRG